MSKRVAIVEVSGGNESLLCGVAARSMSLAGSDDSIQFVPMLDFRDLFGEKPGIGPGATFSYLKLDHTAREPLETATRTWPWDHLRADLVVAKIAAEPTDAARLAGLVVQELETVGYAVSVVVPLLPVLKQAQLDYESYLCGGGVDSFAFWAGRTDYRTTDADFSVWKSVLPDRPPNVIATNKDLDQLRMASLGHLIPTGPGKIMPFQCIAPSAFELLRLANRAILRLAPEDRSKARSFVVATVRQFASAPLYAPLSEELFVGNALSASITDHLSDRLHRQVDADHLVTLLHHCGAAISGHESEWNGKVRSGVAA
ncbi:MAG: hypothetical protein RIC87_11415 [Kiloniellales bacterium]